VSRTEPEGMMDFFSKKIFRIPSYQRSYSWEHKQIEELWEDIIDGTKHAPDTDHFFGMIILYDTGEQKKDKKRKEIKVYDVVDGQQRLTSISLLSVSLILELRENGLEDSYEGIMKGMYNYIKNEERDFNRIKLSNINKSYYNKIIDRTLQEDGSQGLPEPDNLSDERIRYAVNYFRKRIRPLLNDREEIESIVDYINNKIKVVEFIAQEGSEELAIKAFQLVNDRGKAITLLEKSKSFLIFFATKFLNDIEPPDDEKDLKEEINDRFTRLFDSFDNIKKLGEEKDINYVERKKFSEDDILPFFYHNFKKYANERYRLEGYDYDIKAEDVYENVIKEGCNALRAEKRSAARFIRDMVEALEEVTSAFEDVLSNEFEDEKIKELIRRQNPNVRTYHLLVSAKAEDRLDEELLEIIRVLNMRLYRIAHSSAMSDLYKKGVAEFKRGTSNEKIKKDLIGFIKKNGADGRIRRILTDPIYNKSSDKGEKLILWEHGAESYGTTQGDHDPDAVFEALERDHVFPDREESQIDVDQYGFEDEDDFDEQKDRIGNLVLLEGSKASKELDGKENLNSKAGNRPPRRKAKEIYPLSVFLPTNILGDKISKQALNKRWLEDRTKELADFAIEHWKIPDIED